MRNMKLKSIESERNVKGNVLFFARIKTRQNANQREKKNEKKQYIYECTIAKAY